jgi:aspartate-semialdehyde dehydrogenase
MTTQPGNEDLTACVLGATGLLGAEIVRLLDAAPWRPGRLIALASGRGEATHVAYGDERVAVDEAADQAWADADVVFLAAPASVSEAAGREALRQGTAVVDCSGALAADLPTFVPWLDPEPPGSARGVVVPGAATLLVASALAPLRRAGVDAPASAVVLLPASTAGRAGLAELSGQVVALLNGGAPPRKVFDGGLAFDLVPTVGPVTPGGWTAREREVAASVHRLAGGDAPIDVTLVQVPVFSGAAAAVHVSARAPVDRVRELLVGAGLLVSESRTGPRPRRVEGSPMPHLGRVRSGADGSLHLWLAMDNLCCAATAAVGAAARLLRKAGRLAA